MRTRRTGRRNGAGAYPGRTISDVAHGHVGREVQWEVYSIQERKLGTFGINANGDERARGRNRKERRRSSVMLLTKGSTSIGYFNIFDGISYNECRFYLPNAY